MKNRNEGNKAGRPLYFDRSTTVIGRLGHHVETRNRRKSAGYQHAACVLSIRFARQRAKPLWFFFYLYLSLCALIPLRTFLFVQISTSKCSCSSSYALIIRSDIQRNLQRFCCAGLLSRAERCASARGFQMLFRIRRGKLPGAKFAPID